MNMICSARIMTWKYGLKLNDPIRVSLLDAAEEGSVEVGGVVFVAISAGDDSGVDPGTVAIPDVPIEVGEGLASFDIDKLAVDDDRDAKLSISEILTDELSFDPVLTELAFRNDPQRHILNLQVQSLPQA